MVKRLFHAMDAKNITPATLAQALDPIKEILDSSPNPKVVTELARHHSDYVAIGEVVGEWLATPGAKTLDLVDALKPIYTYEKSTTCNRALAQQFMPTATSDAGEVWFADEALFIGMKGIDIVKRELEELKSRR